MEKEERVIVDFVPSSEAMTTNPGVTTLWSLTRTHTLPSAVVFHAPVIHYLKITLLQRDNLCLISTRVENQNMFGGI